MSSVTWHEYPTLEPISRLRNEGRELIGKDIWFTEKRDGENVSIWLREVTDLKNVTTFEANISSHHQESAESEIAQRLRLTPEFAKALDLLRTEKTIYGSDYILYGELLKTVSPTRIEPKRKHTHWVIFDIWSVKEGRFLPYNRVYQYAYGYKIPMVGWVGFAEPTSMEGLEEAIEGALKWCRIEIEDVVEAETREEAQREFLKMVDDIGSSYYYSSQDVEVEEIEKA